MADGRVDEPRPGTVVIDLQFLPCLDYFACIQYFDLILLEACELLPRRTSRNRTRVLTANKVDVLTVPLQASRKAIPMRDVKIDYEQDWQRRHLRCLQSAYGKAPFFEYYFPEIDTAYRRKPTFLLDLNYDLLTLCLRFLGIPKTVGYTLSYTPEKLGTNFDARSLIDNKKRGNNYILYKSVPYQQTFGNHFVSNLSIVDLLFNKGPEARLVLKEFGRSPKTDAMNKA